jgi:hypothetical protein
MYKSFVALMAVALSVASPAGASPSAAPPPPGGTISIEPKVGERDGQLVPAFVTAATEELAAKGFTILEGSGHAAYVAELVLSREEVGTTSAKVQGGSTTYVPGGVYNSVGAGITVPLGTGKSRLVPLQRTTLQLRIRKRGADDIVWEGAAVTVRAGGTPNGAEPAVASDLSAAVLRPYPDRVKDVVSVP